METEIVTRPTQRGVEHRVWRMHYPLDFLGKKGKDLLLNTVALHLSESDEAIECVIWADEGVVGGTPSFLIYLTFAHSEERPGILLRLADDLDPGGTLLESVLNGSAIPTLKRLANGKVIRLWPDPSPDLPGRQKMTVDWGTFEILNRVYVIS